MTARRIVLASTLALAGLLLAARPIAAWTPPLGSGQFSPAATNVFMRPGPGSWGPGAYKFGYGEYSDRFGFRPAEPANAPSTTMFPSMRFGFQQPAPPPPPVFPITTFGGYRSGTVGAALLPGVFR